MDEIIVENVRCFYNRQTVPLRRLTFLVGENSTGKTTFLALTRLAWDLANGNFTVNFNDEPFELGTYDQIASLRGGRAGRAESFTIGASFMVAPMQKREAARPSAEKVSVIGNFVNDKGSPRLRESTVHDGDYTINLNYEEGSELPPISITTPTSSFKIKDKSFFYRLKNLDQFFLIFGILLERGTDQFGESEGSLDSTAIKAVQKLSETLAEQSGARPFAFAPIRTHPKRTYDPLADEPRPEGSHVPMVMAKTASSDPKTWEQLKQVLERFGTEAGLFSGVDVVRMGDKESAPFQIRIKVSSHGFNLVDVGYGVSQVLPIIFDSLRQSKRAFLLQQPEVHLHPRAQAALGSFLAFLAKEHNKQFLIETHSDYILDRVRRDVRARQIGADEVIILYFERENGGVTITPLQLDENGNIVNAPASYRQFFLEEEMRVLAG